MAGTQLYDKEHNKIYPNTNSSDVLIDNSSLSNLGPNVNDQLHTIYNKFTEVNEEFKKVNETIAKITGDEEAVTLINVTVTYCKAKTKNQDELIADPTIYWVDVYETPNAEFPYTWKKTEISVAETIKTFYELVASDTSDTTQTIYVALSNDTQPIIVYPKKIVNGEETEDDDLTAFDVYLPGSGINDTDNVKWSETPQSISAQQPYLYMSTRKRIDGIWNRFSTPALLGRWAFDSKIELRYTITDINVTKDQLEFNNTSTDPGTIWLLQTPDTYTGKLWMITATSVNGVLNKDSQNVIWNGPHLLSIIQ